VSTAPGESASADGEKPDGRARNEANFQIIIERSPDAVLVYQGHTIRYVNARLLDLLGYEQPDEMLGRSVFELVHPDDVLMVSQRMRNFSMRGQPAPAAKERFLRKDGAAVPVEVTTIPIFWDDAPATLVHARDLSQQTRLEAQLVMADRLASVGRLAAAVGHEINNPLAYVMANLDLALEQLSSCEGLPPDRVGDVVDMLREAREGADRVRHIVRDLKVFLRGETEERVRVDPRRVLDSCVNMARGEIRPRARLSTHYEDTPRVMANEARLGQVLLNLLVNAAHAIPEGDAESNEIEVSTRLDQRGYVVIAVRDSGAGIPDDVKKHLFEPFFTTKGGGRGTGLGLSICQSIVAAMGGEITFDSEVGRGSTFRVSLPAAPPAPDPPTLL
jgi:PAS domain S-box-containing protein